MSWSSREGQLRPLVLRIGVVRAGRVIEEKVLERGQALTLGTAPRCTVTLGGAEKPHKRTVLKPTARGTWEIVAAEDLVGRVAIGDQVIDLVDAPKGALGLESGVRGRLVVEGVTVLFQVVPAPVLVGETTRGAFRPRLIDGDDPVFLGFLSVFTALAAVFLVHVSTTAPIERVALDDIPPRFAQIVIAPDPVVDEVIVPVEVEDDAEPIDKRSSDRDDEPIAEDAPEPEPEPQNDARRPSREDLERQIERESKLLAALIATTGPNSSGSTSAPWAEDSATDRELIEALKGVTGIELATADGPRIKTGFQEGDARLDGIGGLSVGTVDVEEGVGETAPRGRMKQGPIDTVLDGGDSASIATVIDGSSAQIRSCYERELKRDPTLEGRLELSWTVSRGRAVGLSVTGNTTGSEAVEVCATTRVRTWRFPADARGQVIVPFILTPGR